MPAIALDWKTEREELKAQRNLLFNRYVRNPNEIRMAVEIKKIDDQIAELTEHMSSRN